ncbi:MAG: TerB family tellurite resistance protein [Bacteroidales bacterium]|nr:TerB family tellurite resistance protein [Bacteroidales bacterium]
MGSAKWLVGFLGWVSWGPIGALLGFFLGSAIDTVVDMSRQLPGAGGQSSGQSSGPRQYSRPGGYSATEQRNSFFVSLLVLSSAVIKADGRTHPAELDYVKSFIRNNFGDSAVGEAVRILESLNSQQVNIYSVGPQIARNMNYSQRMQLFDYLTRIAVADGDFSKSEKDVLEAIAGVIGLTSSDAASIIAMFYKEADSAYSVLEISPSATNDEVKAAYRRMAMKNHPDKVATLGPEVQKAAAEKFRKVQEAYETIKRQRGMS